MPFPSGKVGTFEDYVITTGIYAHPNLVAEQFPAALTFAVDKQTLDVRLDMVNIIQPTIIREYGSVDGVNWRQISRKTFPTQFDTGTLEIILAIQLGNEAYMISIQSTVLEGAIRNIPYRITSRWSA